MAPRGRPPRAGTKADVTVKLTLTRAELDALLRLANFHRTTIADAIRLVALDAAAELDNFPKDSEETGISRPLNKSRANTLLTAHGTRR